MIEQKLTPKQQAFADFYIELGNATQSAIKAGYSKKYANTNANKLLQNTTIKKYIENRMQEINSKRIADQTEVMEFLTAVMRGEVDEPIPLLDGDGYQKVVHVRPNVTTRRAAAVDIGKRYAMWTDKQEINATVTPVFIDDISGDNDE